MIVSLSLNQAKDMLAVAANEGFAVYALKDDFCEEKIRRDLPSSDSRNGLNMVEMLGRSNFLALVGSKCTIAQNESASISNCTAEKVIIWDDSQTCPVIELEFKSSVLAVRLTKEYVIVGVHGKIYIYSFSNEPELVKILTCSSAITQDSMCIFGAEEGPRTQFGSICAFASSRTGAVEIIKLTDIENSKHDALLIYAHNSNVIQIAMNQNGTLLATASEKGTIIRVFELNLEQGISKCIYEFRRGTDWATIYCLSFSSDSRYLAVSSSTGTIHIFKLNSNTEEATRHEKSIRKAIIKQYVPNYLLSQWSFAQASLGNLLKNVIIFGKNDNVFLVISTDGFLYKFAINHKRGGECVELDKIRYFR